MRIAKEYRQERAQLVADARALIEADTSDEGMAKFDAMMAKADDLLAKAERFEKAADALAAKEESLQATSERRGVSVGEQENVEEKDAKAFAAYLRRGMAGIPGELQAHAQQRYQAAQSVGTGSAGGYTVPQGFYQELIDAQLAYGGMLEVAKIIDTATGNTLPIPTDNDTSNAGAILSENTQVSGQDVTFGTISLGAYTYTSKLVLVSNQLLQDTAFNLDAFLRDKLATRLARIVNTHMTTGTGSSQPNGVVTAATSGTVGTTGQTTSVVFNDLVNLQHSVDPAYRKGAVFMMGDSSLKVIKKLVDSQSRPLWLPGIAVKEPDTILGMPYVVNQDMPAMAANAKSILFGDFSNYFIRRVAGVQVLRLTERYADYNQTGFLAFQRWDGNLIDAGTHPIKYYANSAT